MPAVSSLPEFYLLTHPQELCARRSCCLQDSPSFLCGLLPQGAESKDLEVTYNWPAFLFFLIMNFLVRDQQLGNKASVLLRVWVRIQ